MEEHTKLKEWKGEGGGNIDYMRHEINYILAIFRSSYDFLKSEMGRLGLSFGRDGVDASNDIEEAIERLQKFTKNISIEGILQKIKDFDAGNGVGLEEKEAESEVLLRKKIDTLSFFFHEINNSLAVLDSNHFFLEGEISRLNLDLREDGKASLGDMGTAIRELKTFVGSRNGVQPKSDHKEGSLNSEEAAPEKIKDRMVFLIDDDERIMKALRRVIKGEFQNGDSPNIRTFNSALSAKEAIEEGVIPDYIVCDMSMPGMSGRMFYEWLESNHHSLAEGFIFLSGGGIDGKDRDFLNSMNLKGRALDKPFDIGKIRNLIQGCLS